MKKTFQHHILFLQLQNFMLLQLLSILQLFYTFFEVLQLLHCIALLLLTQFSTLSISTNTLTFFAATTLIPIKRTFIEKFRHLIRIKIGFADLPSYQ